MVAKNLVELREYLAGLGLDAGLIKADGADETGYDLMFAHPDGRPVYAHGFVRKTERRQWPSPEVWERVHELYYGKPVKKETVKPEEPKGDDTPEPVKKETPPPAKPAASKRKTK